MSTDESSDEPPVTPDQPPEFRCDLCGEPIHDLPAAWGQWHAEQPDGPGGKVRNWGFCIVHGEAHSPTCTLREHSYESIGDCSLEFLLSPDGLAYLLEFFVDREVDNAELSRFIMRLFVPRYEQAHRFISAAIADGLHEPRGNRDFLSQGEIRKILAGRDEGRYGAYA